ncbi:MAG: L-ribulose-5-phosphate 4-epimerase [Bacteroidales bacterium]
MVEALKLQVFNANMALVAHKLVIFTWGNVSGIDRDKKLMVIKPSGVSYEEMTPEDMVVMDMDGNVVEGKLKPSSDSATHLVLYRSFKNTGGIVHTHSEWATSWAQSGLDIPCYGTTHADYFYGAIPCTRRLKKKEIKGNYEEETGNVIVERFKRLNPDDVSGVLVNNHGPFSWGKDPNNAVHNAVVMEEVAKMAFRTRVLGNNIPVRQTLLDKHFLRKHGKDAYYGQ